MIKKFIKHLLEVSKYGEYKETSKPMHAKDLKSAIPGHLFNSLIKHAFYKKYIAHPFNTPVFTHGIDKNGFHHIEAAHVENLKDPNKDTLKYKVHFTATGTKVISATKYHKHGPKAEDDSWRIITSTVKNTANENNKIRTKSFLNFLKEATTHDVSGWKKIGHKLGSNEGGVHVDEKGNKHYVKIAKNPNQAREEVASAEIHEKLGVKTLRPRLINMSGRVGTATMWNGDLVRKKPEEFEKIDEKQARTIMRIHHAGIITKNWDTVGLEHDNIEFHKKTGEPHAVDQGGSFHFRAQGAPKNYEEDIDEIHSYRNPELNSSAHHVFSHIDTHFPHVAKEELTHAKKLTYNDVYDSLRAAGVKNAHKIAKTSIVRRDLLLKHYGE
jgi:hypothetical protein